MPVRLTETAIRAALGRAAQTRRRFDLADVTLPGLRLRLTPAGSATWALACRDPHGRMRRFTLGDFPAMGVAEARNRARTLRTRVREGEDPVAERRRVRAAGRDAKAGIGTLAAVLDLYAAGPGAEKKTWRPMRRKVELVFVAHLGRPLAAATAAELQMSADGYRSKATAGAAARYLRPILKWAAKSGYAAREAALIEQPATSRRRDRVLTQEELAALLPVLSSSPRPYRRAFLFMLLTLARREEVAGARWRDVNLAAAEWRIPAANVKNGVEHRVPLSRQAVELLRAAGGPRAPGERVFRTPATRGEGRLTNWDREAKAVMAETGTAGWTRHDLRRTGATMLGELGVEPHVIEAALNHAAIHSPLAATYNRARYMPAVRNALQLLADRIDGIATGAAADVVPLPRRA